MSTGVRLWTTRPTHHLLLCSDVQARPLSFCLGICKLVDGQDILWKRYKFCPFIICPNSWPVVLPSHCHCPAAPAAWIPPWAVLALAQSSQDPITEVAESPVQMAGPYIHVRLTDVNIGLTFGQTHCRYLEGQSYYHLLTPPWWSIVSWVTLMSWIATASHTRRIHSPFSRR